MKKVLLLALLIVGCGMVKADFIDSYGFKIGIVNAKQDFNYSDLDLQPYPNSITELVAGVSFEHIINSKFSFQSGLEFMTKGAKSDPLPLFGDNPNETLGTMVFEMNLDYLSIPIELKYSSTHLKYKPYGFFGLKYDKLIKKSNNGSLSDKIKNTEYHLTYGIGIMKEIKRYKLIGIGLEIRGSYPLTFTYSTDLLEIKNFTTDISLLFQL